MRRRRGHRSWRRYRSLALGVVATLLTLEIVYRLVALPPDYRPDQHEAMLPTAEAPAEPPPPVVAGADETATATIRLSRQLDLPPSRPALVLAPAPTGTPAAAPADSRTVVALAPIADMAGLRLTRTIDRPADRTVAVLDGQSTVDAPPPAEPPLVAARLKPTVESPMTMPSAPPPRPSASAVPVGLPVAPRRLAPAPRGDQGGTPVAIIIDDMGYSASALGRLAAMPGPLTLAFLPNADATPAMLEAARQRDFELMLHLPMEPLGDANPGPEALLVDLDETELRRRLRAAIDKVPGAMGVNNHMGSRFTADVRGLQIVMDELRQSGLYFVDSRTNPASLAERVARHVGVPSTSRDIFIDHDPAPAAIARQLAAIERFANFNGSVIAIGHPYPTTLAALEAWLPTLAGRGFRLTRLSEVLAQRLCARAVSGAEPCGPALQLIGYEVGARGDADLPGRTAAATGAAP